MGREFHGIDAERAKALRGARRAEEVTETGCGTLASNRTGRPDLGSPQGGCIGTACRHYSFLIPDWMTSLLGLP
jgi:hypothetical protein